MYIDLTLSLNELSMDKEIMNEKADIIFKSGHYGTHIDIHLQTEIPLEYMANRALLFDVSHIKDRDIESTDIDIDAIKAKDCLIFKTDRIKEHTYGSQAYFYQHPQLSDALIDILIAKKIHIIAIDAAGIRRGKEHALADKRCEAQSVYIVENITNLDSLITQVKGDFQIHLMWLNLPEKTGLPCKIVAKLS
ncbi:Putative cyclase [Legionella busanensis]|uniref:Cyclase n=1 Tax=Legionella busanensis TaxID=190655 RepID=A0A378JLB5_9GAMM|nr:cyclase family protein [Legionella busanensis]STX51478.1 Putative cyclase [Legionella busanensis]